MATRTIDRLHAEFCHCARIYCRVCGVGKTCLGSQTRRSQVTARSWSTRHNSSPISTRRSFRSTLSERSWQCWAHFTARSKLHRPILRETTLAVAPNWLTTWRPAADASPGHLLVCQLFALLVLAVSFVHQLRVVEGETCRADRRANTRQSIYRRFCVRGDMSIESLDGPPLAGRASDAVRIVRAQLDRRCRSLFSWRLRGYWDFRRMVGDGNPFGNARAGRSSLPGWATTCRRNPADLSAR